MKIYIALLQVDYSGALPIPAALLKGRFLGEHKNKSEWTLWKSAVPKKAHSRVNQ